MSILACTATLGFSCVVTEPLLLASQPLLANPSIPATYTLANGLVAVDGAIDLHFEEIGVTLAASGTKTYTLSALVDTLPRTLAFTHVHTVIIKVTSRTAGDYLTAGPGNTHGWTALVATGTMKVYGLFVYHVDKVDSLAVAAGSNDQFTLTNAGSNPLTYNIAFLGNSG